ncbi:uncharacterized protein LOC107001909 [Solanum pennellii]|uniref:Uncharacterized protein LOC107001909 n=1 Tax=Solanum pennellii TaxID=28526 RepID=A0ABM1FDH9_SOLPN|nr:uncharacterized protein LOC107001909 [Solanum pennellii]
MNLHPFRISIPMDFYLSINLFDVLLNSIVKRFSSPENFHYSLLPPSTPRLIKDGSSQFITLIGEDYNDYLQYQTSRKQSSTACTIQLGNSFSYGAQSSSQEQWILDAGDSDNISVSAINLKSTELQASTSHTKGEFT